MGRGKTCRFAGGLRTLVQVSPVERYSVDQYQAGFDAMLSGQAGKVAPISACAACEHVIMRECRP